MIIAMKLDLHTIYTWNSDSHVWQIQTHNDLVKK